MIGRLRRPTGWLLAFGAVSLLAVGLGAFVSAASGVPAALWIRNLAAWAVGAVAAVGIAATWRPRAAVVALWLAPLGLAATFLGADLQGVHRWSDLGPVHMNMAMLLLPPAVVSLAALAGERRWPWIPVVLSLGLLVAQPDASQATTLAAAVMLIAALVEPRPIPRILVMVAAGLAASLAWLQPDPLLPVPEVEGIVGLAFELSPMAGALASLLLVAVAGAPAAWTISAEPPVRRAGAALGVCFLLWAITPMLGAFPVPLVGIGLSPILGAWLGAGALAGLMRREQP